MSVAEATNGFLLYLADTFTRKLKAVGDLFKRHGRLIVETIEKLKNFTLSCRKSRKSTLDFKLQRVVHEHHVGLKLLGVAKNVE
jgi:hypothetical protein